MKKTFATGLYSYSTPKINNSTLKNFYNLINSAFQSNGITPTHIAAEGDGYNGKITKIQSTVRSRAVDNDFSGIHTLSIIASTMDSKEPGYDSYASASLGYVEDANETVLCISANQDYIKFPSPTFDDILKELILLHPWDFGYALSQPTEQNPEFHVLALDDGNLSAENYQKLIKWYDTPPQERVKKIRDIYPYNIINTLQLNSEITSGHTLKDLIEADPHCNLEKIKESKLWLWTVQENHETKLREKLKGSNIMIT